MTCGCLRGCRALRKGAIETCEDYWMEGLKPGDLKLHHVQWGGLWRPGDKWGPPQVHLTADPRMHPVVTSRPLVMLLDWLDFHVGRILTLTQTPPSAPPPLVEKEPLGGKSQVELPPPGEDGNSEARTQPGSNCEDFVHHQKRRDAAELPQHMCVPTPGPPFPDSCKCGGSWRTKLS